MAYLDESGVTSLTADIKALADADYAPYAQGIEYIRGTQTAATHAWGGVTVDSTLRTGKVIAYYLPYTGDSSAATLNLTLADGTHTGAKALRRQGSSTVTTHFAAGNVLILIYDGTYWKVSAYYASDSNTVPTGYCTTAAATAAKAATCTYGYRDDATYFPCLFRYGNTAANATLAISSYATTALPIYVNGARTSSSNTFGAGVIMFLYYNNAYYCYNDGRFPIVLNGAVTSVQDALASVSGGSSVSVTQTLSSGTEIASIDVDGTSTTLYAPSEYTLPAATTSTLGGVKVDGSTITISNGVISATSGGGGGGINKVTLYTDDSTLYTDASHTTTFIESCGYDYDVARDTLENADVIEVFKYYDSNQMVRYLATYINFDSIDETYQLGYMLKNGTMKAIGI